MIYFVEAVGANLVKIGFTEREVSDRLRELQTASPHVLRIAATMKGGLKEEGELHQKFAHLQTTGEWFKFDVELRAVTACLIGLEIVLMPLKDELQRLQHEITYMRTHNCISSRTTGDPGTEGFEVITPDEFVDELDLRVRHIEVALNRLGSAFEIPF